MKRAVCVILLAVIAFVMSLPAAAVPDISAHSAIVVCADGGQVLYEHNADEESLVASTTKIMTAIVVIEHCRMDDLVTVPAQCAGVEGSSAYIKAGDTYTVEQLLFGMMLVSGNDAALVLADHVSGSAADFAELMNDKARELGMDHSSFKNPHGLDEDGHFSTARDLAVLTSYCMENADFRRIVGTKSTTVAEQTYVNHNKLLWNCEGVTGVKTGYTKASGRSLVSCCERGGLRLVCVTLGAPDDWKDHSSLYDWAYAMWHAPLFCSPEDVYELPLISGMEETVAASPERELRTLLQYTSEEPQVRIELPRFVFAPVEAGEAVGRVVVSLEGEELCSCDIVARQSVPLREKAALTPFERFARMWRLMERMSPYTYYITEEKL